MLVKMDSKMAVNNNDYRDNFSSDSVEIKNKMGVSSFSDLSQHHFNFLLNYDCATKANDTLAGHIENQFFYDEWPEDFEKYLISKVISDDDLLEQAKGHFPTKFRIFHDTYHEIDSKKLRDNADTLKIKGLWINKQKKYEFNPLHKHTGVFSFIIPLQIPFDLNEEDKVFTVGKVEKSPKTSRLEFFKYEYENNELIGHCLNMDKSYIGKILIFPSSLYHMVYPFFTSDGIRITVSGNIVLRETFK